MIELDVERVRMRHFGRLEVGLLRLSSVREFASVVVVGWMEIGGDVCLMRVVRSWIWRVGIRNCLFYTLYLLNGAEVYLSISYDVLDVCRGCDAMLFQRDIVICSKRR